MAPTFTERTSGREPSGRFGVDMAEYQRTYVLTELLADGSSIPIDTINITDRIRAITGTTLPGPVTAPAVGLPGARWLAQSHPAHVRSDDPFAVRRHAHRARRPWRGLLGDSVSQ